MAKPEFVTRNSPRLTLQGARLILAVAARRAAAIGVPMDIAVSKAWTAACARRATHEYAEIAAPGRPAFGIHVSNQGRFMIVGGGLPIFVDGRIVGGIGCSSGTTQQDREVATAGIGALSARTRSVRRRPKARGTA